MNYDSIELGNGVWSRFCFGCRWAFITNDPGQHFCSKACSDKIDDMTAYYIASLVTRPPAAGRKNYCDEPTHDRR